MFSLKKWVRDWQDSRRPNRTMIRGRSARRSTPLAMPLEDRTVPTSASASGVADRTSGSTVPTSTIRAHQPVAGEPGPCHTALIQVQKPAGAAFLRAYVAAEYAVFGVTSQR